MSKRNVTPATGQGNGPISEGIITRSEYQGDMSSGVAAEGFSQCQFELILFRKKCVQEFNVNLYKIYCNATTLLILLMYYKIFNINY